jgi:hypothetical protein
MSPIKIYRSFIKNFVVQQTSKVIIPFVTLSIYLKHSIIKINHRQSFLSYNLEDGGTCVRREG